MHRSRGKNRTCSEYKGSSGNHAAQNDSPARKTDKIALAFRETISPSAGRGPCELDILTASGLTSLDGPAQSCASFDESVPPPARRKRGTLDVRIRNQISVSGHFALPGGAPVRFSSFEACSNHLSRTRSFSSALENSKCCGVSHPSNRIETDVGLSANISCTFCHGIEGGTSPASIVKYYEHSSPAQDRAAEKPINRVPYGIWQ